MKVKVISNQWNLKTVEWSIGSHYEYVSLKVGLSAILHDLTLPTIAHLHQLWDIGVDGGIGV